MPTNADPKIQITLTESQPVEKLYMENTLLRVSGALFCHDAKRASSRKAKIELNRGVKEKRIVIEPHPTYGQPGPLAHKVFFAMLKKHSDYGRPHPSEVSFTKREIMRLIGRKEWGGKDSQELTRALSEVQRTFITAHFKKSNRWFEHTFNIFPKVLLERSEDREGAQIESCTITLAEPIVTSLCEDHFSCYNYFFLQRLGTIGQAIYLRAFFHFANLYEVKQGKKALQYKKRYDDMCVEWLGGLTVLQHKSKIINEQLGTHLQQLQHAGFLSSYSIDKAESGDGFVITFRPGAGFFVDYERFYKNRHQGELQWDFHADRQQIAEPLKLAHLFQEKRTGKQVEFGVSTNETQNAKEILAQVPFEEATAFLDYALAEAKKTNFDVKALGGLKQYVGSYIASRHRVKAHREAQLQRQAEERAKGQQEADRAAYEQARRQAIDDLFARLPENEQQVINELAKGEAAANRFGNNSQVYTTIARRRIIANRHPDKIPSVEDWTATRRGQGGVLTK